MANIFSTTITERLFASAESEITCWGGVSMIVVVFLYTVLLFSSVFPGECQDSNFKQATTASYQIHTCSPFMIIFLPVPSAVEMVSSKNLTIHQQLLS
jgi:hypothetical protein